MCRLRPFLLLCALATASCQPDGPAKPSASPDPIDPVEVDREVKALAKSLKKELLAALDGGDGRTLGIDVS